jgi:hypothetical protein
MSDEEIHFELVYLQSINQKHTNFPKIKSRCYLRITGARWVTWSDFHTEDPQILSVTAQNIVPRYLYTPDLKHISPMRKTIKPLPIPAIIVVREISHLVPHYESDVKGLVFHNTYEYQTRCSRFVARCLATPSNSHCGMCGQRGHGETPCPGHNSCPYLRKEEAM